MGFFEHVLKSPSRRRLLRKMGFSGRPRLLVLRRLALKRDKFYGPEIDVLGKVFKEICRTSVIDWFFVSSTLKYVVTIAIRSISS